MISSVLDLGDLLNLIKTASQVFDFTSNWLVGTTFDARVNVRFELSSHNSLLNKILE